MNSIKKHFYILLAAAFLAVSFMGAPAVQAEPLEYQGLRKEYNELRRTDPYWSATRKWRSLGRKFELFLEQGASDDEEARALFLLGSLFEALHRKATTSSESDLQEAIAKFEELARKHEGHRLADDGLIALGDLRRDGLSDIVAARAAYFEVVDSYSDGDQVKRAKKRIAELETIAPISPKKEPVSQDNASTAASLPILTTTTVRSISTMPEVVTERRSGQRPLVVIDPGHGGDNLGAVGVEGVLEKDVVLKVSILLEDLLRERLNARTLLTRRTDIALDLAERTQIANDAQADLFISIHANASVDRNVSGVETYYLDNTNDRSSLKLAERENQSFSQGTDDLSFMLSDLIQAGKMDESITLAHHLQDALHGTLARYYGSVRNLGVKKAPFYVLVGAHMPCVLVEISFIDHPIEGKRLLSTRYQRLIAQSLYEGVRDYFHANPSYQTKVDSGSVSPKS